MQDTGETRPGPPPPKPKSILDKLFPVENKAFPLAPESLSVVSSCPSCGAPVYGHEKTTSLTPEVRYSCSCRKNVAPPSREMISERK